MAAKGAPFDTATARKPSGSLVTRSPWLIHTGGRSPERQTPWNSGVSPVISKLGAAEFAGMPAFHLAAEGRHHGLLAIADAEDGHAGVGDGWRELRRAGLMHRCRSAGEDDGLWQDRLERRLGLVEGHDFRIDAGLPHPPRDELGVLGAEIDDEHFVRVVRHGVG